MARVAMVGENMTRLCELAEKYGSDKTPSIFHGYTPFYDELLKDRDVKRVLEIGIGNVACMNHVKDYKPGASLRMWRDYFPKNFLRVDNDPGVLFNDTERSIPCHATRASIIAYWILLWLVL